MKEQEAYGRYKDEEQQATAPSAALADLLPPYPLAALAGGSRRGLDLVAELIVVPQFGDDVGGVLAGELVYVWSGPTR